MQTESKAHSRIYQLIVPPLVALALGATPTLSHATTVTYDEGVSGDLSGQLSGALTFNFDNGVNFISGTQTMIGNIPDLIWDIDGFNFTLPAGSELTSVTFLWNVTLLPGTTQLIQGYSLYDITSLPPGATNPGTAITSTTVGLLNFSSPVSLFDASLPTTTNPTSLPLSSGPLYRFAASSGFIQPASNLGGSWQYLLEFNVAPTVAPVPTPATLPLFATGLGLMGLLGWRRRRRAGAD